MLPTSITSTGMPAVRATCFKLKITFDPWQDGAATAILGKGPDRLYAADAVVISIPRQVGKTYLIGAIIFALCIQKKTLCLWTAHRYVTASDTFNDLKTLAQKPALRNHIKRVTTGTGNQAIEFNNGSKILFGARERGFGRGFKRVGILVFDEAQILTENAIDDMVPATNRHPNPLIIYLGTPPKPKDPGEVFTNLREQALSGEVEDILYIELSADPDADPNDREQWAKANPSYPKHTSTRAMLRMKKNLGAAAFLLEGLGIWNDTATIGAFTAGSWGRGAVTGPPPRPAGLGIACDLDQVWGSLGVASDTTSGGKVHLGIPTSRETGKPLRVRIDRKADRATFVAEVKRIQVENRCPVAIDEKGPASFLIKDLEAAGVDLVKASQDDFMQACSDIKAKVENDGAEHGHYEALDEAVEAAGWKTVGDRRRFTRRGGEIDALEAVALALWATGQGSTFAMYGGGDLAMCDRCGERPHDDPHGEHEYLCVECREA